MLGEIGGVWIMEIGMKNKKSTQKHKVVS